jgi:nucleoid-associated protein YgaU
VIYLNDFNLKKFLKTIKLNESTISMVLGIIVVLIVGSLVVSYIKNRQGSVPDELIQQNNSIEKSVKTHKVAAGENLWIIAEKYYNDGFAWVDIATENKLANASEIEEGQELVIPELEKENTEVADDKPTDQEITTSESISETTYVVQKGDNLWNIAVRAYGDGYRWTEIAKNNNLANPNLIHGGNKLVLPK